jgi:hypothetical protein
VDVADLLVAAHLAGRVIGFVRRLAVGAQVDHVHAVPPLVGHSRLVPTAAAHTKSPHFKVLKLGEFLHGRYADPLVVASFMVITTRHVHKSK